LRIPKPELESQITQKANEIATQARKDGGKASEEAFAQLVNGYSEDPASKANGGKLPGLVKENKQKPDDPYQRLLTMQPGEVTEPINMKAAISFCGAAKPFRKISRTHERKSKSA
jgi:hypothetical protein